jgi:hypothetical protein
MSRTFILDPMTAKKSNNQSGYFWSMGRAWQYLPIITKQRLYLFLQENPQPTIVLAVIAPKTNVSEET